MSRIVNLDTILLYKQTGEKEEHYIDPTLTNEERLKLFAKLMGGKGESEEEVCGKNCEHVGVHVFVRCAGTFDEDGMNNAASQLCGLAVAGDALIVADELMEQWNCEDCD